jgi:glyoxylate/hydroxypyruvate reductase A
VKVLIASFLELPHVERIRAAAPSVEVLYEPALLPRPRHAADHVAPLRRSAKDEAEWRGLLSRAEILFDFDYTNSAELPELAPGVRWIQSTSAGIGQFVKRHGYSTRMPNTIFTTARGVHARPLAEFCALGMLAFSRGLFTMQHLQERKHWERFAGTDLLGKTVVIYGYGAVGRQVGHLARALGMRTIGIKRSIGGSEDTEVRPADSLGEVLPLADFLVLAAPHTPETEHVISARELGLLKRGAVLINVGRGALVDEPALVEALRSGQLGGAFLDVFEEEPLPPESPLWTMPSVLVSPHSASNSERENSLITDLFCENLGLFLSGKPLLNALDVGRLY